MEVGETHFLPTNFTQRLSHRSYSLVVSQTHFSEYCFYAISTGVYTSRMRVPLYLTVQAIIGDEILTECAKGAVLDLLAHTRQKVQIEVEVV